MERNVLSGRNEFVFLDEDGTIQKFEVLLRNMQNCNMIVNIIKDNNYKKFKNFIYCKNIDKNYYILNGKNFCIKYLEKEFDEYEVHEYEEKYFAECSANAMFEDFYFSKKIYPDRIVSVQDKVSGKIIEGLKEPILKKGEYEVYFTPYNMRTRMEKITLKFNGTFRNYIENLNYRGIHNILCIKDKSGKMYLTGNNLRVDYEINGLRNITYIDSDNGDEYEILKEKIFEQITPYSNESDTTKLNKIYKKIKILSIRQDDMRDCKKAFFPLNKNDKIMRLEEKEIEECHVFEELFKDDILRYIQLEEEEKGNTFSEFLFDDEMSEVDEEKFLQSEKIWDNALNEELELEVKK